MVAAANAPEQTNRPWPLGQAVGAVQVQAARHADAQGITYLGHWQDTGEPVLLREYFPLQRAVRTGDQIVPAANQTAAFAAGLAAFIRAAREAQALAHPAYPDILGLWCLNGSAYVALPLPTQPTLEATLLGQPVAPPLKTLLRWLRAWGFALAPLHEQQLAHGGLNPHDLRLLPPQGMVLPALLLPPTLDGHALPYLAPELNMQAAGVATPASDVYAVCAILYRAMAGQPPLPALARQQGLQWLTAGAAGHGAYPARWLAAIDAGLALEPVQRPATVQALLAACGLHSPRARRPVGVHWHHLRPAQWAATLPTADAAAPPPLPTAPAPRTEVAFTQALGLSLRQVVDQARAQPAAAAAEAAAAPENPREASRIATQMRNRLSALARGWKTQTLAHSRSAPACLRDRLSKRWQDLRERQLATSRLTARQGWISAGASLGLLAVVGLVGLMGPSRSTQGGSPMATGAPGKTSANASPRLEPERLPATAAGSTPTPAVVGPVIAPKRTDIVTLRPAKDAAGPAPTPTPTPTPPALAEQEVAAKPVPLAAAHAKPTRAEAEPAKVAANKARAACADQLLRASLGDLAAPSAKTTGQACR
jgi:hypothetical protein